MKVRGLEAGETHRCQFDKRVRELLTEMPTLERVIGPLLRVLEPLVGRAEEDGQAAG